MRENQLLRVATSVIGRRTLAYFWMFLCFWTVLIVLGGDDRSNWFWGHFRVRSWPPVTVPQKAFGAGLVLWILLRKTSHEEVNSHTRPLRAVSSFHDSGTGGRADSSLGRLEGKQSVCGFSFLECKVGICGTQHFRKT